MPANTTRRHFLKLASLAPLGATTAHAAYSPLPSMGKARFTPTLNAYSFLEQLNANIADATTGSTSTVTLSGTSANTFSSLTTVNGGTLLLNKTAGVNEIAGNVTIGDASGVDILQLSASDQIANTSILTFNGTSTNAGTFRMNAQNETVGGIASTSGAGIIENGTSGASTLTLDVNTTDRLFSGIIQNGAAGTLALTKTGNGAQTITGVNTYSGTTTIINPVNR